MNSTNLCPPIRIFSYDFPRANKPSFNKIPPMDTRRVIRVRRHYTSRELGSWNGSTEKRGNWKYWANWPRKNTASIFYEPSQLFRHNERVYGRNYAKLYAATRSPVQLGNARYGDRGKGKSVCTRFSPSIREVGTVETVFIDRRTHRKWLGDGVPCSSYSVELITEPWKVKRPAW